MNTDTPTVPPKRVVWILGSLAVTSAGITLLFLGMRAVMDIGGFCAEGGPYVIAQGCPDGVPVLMIAGIWIGIIAAFVYAGASIGAGVPTFTGLLWPALFMSLGWNFLQYAFLPPSGDGVIYGWLIPGIVFELMGGIPLWLWIKTRGIAPQPGTRTRSLLAPPGARVVASAIRSALSPPVAKAVATALRDAGDSPGVPKPDREPEMGPDLVSQLERLDALHDSGALSDIEYEKAKRRLLA